VTAAGVLLLLPQVLALALAPLLLQVLMLLAIVPLLLLVVLALVISNQQGLAVSAVTYLSRRW
jgi:hypothetical protein